MQRLLLGVALTAVIGAVVSMPLWYRGPRILCSVHISDTRDTVRQKCGVPMQEKTVQMDGESYDAWAYFSMGRSPSSGMRMFMFREDRVALIYDSGRIEK